ncbi:uncharacterized protein LOC129305864 [Prosopis cineraria]|uniref:uncharacterized protein LOC129305864 n=1 Tax=Prosopis cineraria TaxID=364024 RepID=UPI00240FCA71|nr:uncharacterized protein LOC129305864 [Prosopis cineraria]
MKVRVVCRKIYDYIRYDLKEIAFPSSLPDPPHLVKERRKLNWQERIWVLKTAARLYAASWVRDIGPDLRPHEYKKGGLTDEANKGKKTPQEREPSILEDLAVAARGGMETLRPALQRIYMTRASAYRDALKSFIEGYQEGVQGVMEKKEDYNPENATQQVMEKKEDYEPEDANQQVMEKKGDAKPDDAIQHVMEKKEDSKPEHGDVVKKST